MTGKSKVLFVLLYENLRLQLQKFGITKVFFPRNSRDIRMCGETVTKIFSEHLILYSVGDHLFPFDLWFISSSKTTLTASADAKL